ncbi:MAG: glycoside hydrolase family 3 protein [Thermoleophilia bacterium]
MAEKDFAKEGIRRVDRNKSGKKSSRRSQNRHGIRKWLRSPIFWFALAAVFTLAAAGGFLVMKARDGSASASEAPAPVAETAGDTQTSTGEVPLASATEQIVASMSLEEKIGQMMMVGYEGLAPGPEITSAIQEKHIGAVILFGRNIESHEQVTASNAAMQTLAAQAEQPAKLMVAVDQEGGSTRRFTDIGPYYSEPMIGEMGGEAAGAAAQQQASSAARDLKKLGFNTNLAPVVDVSDGWGSVMDGRSYGTDSEVVTELAGMAVRGYNNATTISCPKHFPGHGSADGDSEETLPTIDLSLEAIEQSELPPFKKVIEAGAPMIMVAHLSVPALDATGTPSSLSKPIVTDLLRKNLGFTGVIISDDLEMGAITSNTSVGDAAVAAVIAGNDMIIVGHTPAKQMEAYDALLAAVKAGKIKEDDLNKSVTRIIDMKKKYRLEK